MLVAGSSPLSLLKALKLYRTDYKGLNMTVLYILLLSIIVGESSRHQEVFRRGTESNESAIRRLLKILFEYSSLYFEMIPEQDKDDVYTLINSKAEIEEYLTTKATDRTQETAGLFFKLHKELFPNTVVDDQMNLVIQTINNTWSIDYDVSDARILFIIDSH